MDSRELAKQIMYASKDMDYIDYVETYDEEVNALAREIDKAKELGLIYLLSALEMLSEWKEISSNVKELLHRL